MIPVKGLLRAYRGATALLAPLGPAILNWRKRRGKEDARRLPERMGVAGAPRPDGPLAWLHGASVGEGIALLPLIEQMRARGFNVLVTTGTVTSAQVLGARLPSGAIHQYVPLDAPRYMRRFLDHWRPDLVMLAESELWPNLIIEVKNRNLPLVLVNARVSERSFLRWQKFPAFISALLGGVDLCLAQTSEDAARLMMLGAPRVQVVGNLKFDVPALPAHAGKLADIQAMVGPRPVWVAASTHAGEEDIVLTVHRRVVKHFPNLLTIIVPRHTQRGPEIATLAMKHGVTVGLRSRGEQPGSFTNVYIADTMGELGLFYRVASIVYVGKSMVAKGGQNPIEPAKLGAAILHGPNVANFEEIYGTLDKAQGAIVVTDADTMASTLGMLLSDTALLRKTARAASDAVDDLGGATANILSALEPYFMHLLMEHR